MKTTGFIVMFWAVLALCCDGAQAQERNGNPGPVDVSVHADVEERAQPEPSSQGTAKPPATFSSWPSQPAKPSPSTTAWSAQTTRSKLTEPTEGNKPGQVGGFQRGKQPGSTVGPALDHATAGASGKTRSRPDSFSILPLQHAHDRSALLFPILPPPAPNEMQGFPRPFDQKQPSHLFESFQTNLSDGKGTKAKRSKSHPAKPGRLDPGNPAESTTGGKP